VMCIEIAWGSVLREEWRLGLGKFEHVRVEVADGSRLGR
jgi:hypothetical protein